MPCNHAGMPCHIPQCNRQRSSSQMHHTAVACGIQPCSNAVRSPVCSQMQQLAMGCCSATQHSAAPLGETCFSHNATRLSTGPPTHPGAAASTVSPPASRAGERGVSLQPCHTAMHPCRHAAMQSCSHAMQPCTNATQHAIMPCSMP
jgi:hypothetical protein